MALQRLRQTLQHLQGRGGGGGTGDGDGKSKQSSLTYGPKSPPLREINLGQLLEEQVMSWPDREAIIVPWTGARLTFRQLNQRSKEVARGLLALGVSAGDRVAILSGNREEFVELFFAVGRIGAILVNLNPAYTPIECVNTMKHAGCKLFFTMEYSGRKSTIPVMEELIKDAKRDSPQLPDLEKMFVFDKESPFPGKVLTFEKDLVQLDGPGLMEKVESLTNTVNCYETCVLMYTSGTTAAPKAAELTHYGIINDGRFIGERLKMTKEDVVCNPTPLHHGFGLMLALLSTIPYGASIVLPSQAFDENAALKAIVDEKCTGLHGVPTMIVSILQQYKKSSLPPVRIRMGIVAGSPVPKPLLEQLQATFGFPGLTIIYGATETSGSSHMSTLDDSEEDKLSTVGKPLPHTACKIIDPEGRTLPCNERGEMVISGYLLQKQYYKNPEATKKAMRRDENGVLWMHMGDQATIDERGYTKITGRIKDMIIRGGENIYPAEIEQRLAQHSAVSQASVVGLKDERYGEIVAAFLQSQHGTSRPEDEELREWVRATMGRFKAPRVIFWLGDKGVPDEFPATSSGKIKKVELREIGNKLIGAD